MNSEQNWHVGNAQADGKHRRGWIVGYFIEESPLRVSKDVEIKWGTHAAGEERENWQETEYRTTVLMLISGRFHINLSVDSYTLQQQGDYAMWGPGIGHSWRAEEDSIVVTIRWPSIP